MVKRLFLLACILSSLYLTVNAQYLETFSTPNKGFLLNNANDFTGVNWTLSEWSADNTTGTFAGRDIGDYFSTTAAGKLEAIDLDQEVSWESPLLNISAAGVVTFSVDLNWSGFDNDISGNPCISGAYGTVASLDVIKVLYSLNGGAYTSLSNVRGGATCATIGYINGGGTGLNDLVKVTQPGLSGSTLRIKIIINTNSNAEVVTIDNVSVPQAGVTLGCVPPVVTNPQVTQPTCLVPTGRIIVKATGSATMQYSIDNGATYKNTASFPNLAPGDHYMIKVRYQATPSCAAAYANNPVTINPPPPTPTWYLDADGDGYYAGTQTVCTSPGTGWTSTLPAGGAGDCNDDPLNGGAAINPGVAEICNGLDDNCNGLVDDGTIVLAAPTSIDGPLGVCRNSVDQVFSVTPVPGASSYQWKLPSGATGSSTTNTISVSFGATYVTGNICVKAISSCSVSTQFCREVKYYGAKPATPDVITGKIIGLCTNENYSIPAVANTTSYLWTAPANTTIVSGQGTTQIVLSFGPGFASGTLSVTASNCKGTSAARTLALSRNPATPSGITGPAIEVCAGSTQNYSCALITGATTYAWTVPSGSVINSGQGTNAISVTFPATFTGGKVTVASGTNCGTGTPASLTISSSPGFPAPISGPASVCPSATGLQYSTTLQPGVVYNWIVPNGATITAGQGTASITVNWGTVAGMVKVRGSNACGTSAYRSLSVSLLVCPAPPPVTMAKSVEVMTGEGLVVKIYPNPVRNELMVTLDEFVPNQKMELTLMQADGKVQQAQSLVPTMKGQQVRMDVGRAAEGYYILTAKQQGVTISKQVVIIR